MLSGVARLIANHPSSAPSKAHQKSGPFPPPALPGLNGPMALSDARPAHRRSRCWRRDLRPKRASPDYPDHLSNVPCPLPRWIGTGAFVGCFPIPRGLPRAVRRVGIHNFTFEACSDFTRVTARWIAQPPKAAFVTRLRDSRLPDRPARQLPDQPTTLWMEPPSTGDPRLRGALTVVGYERS